MTEVDSVALSRVGLWKSAVVERSRVYWGFNVSLDWAAVTESPRDPAVIVPIPGALGAASVDVVAVLLMVPSWLQ
ncbi:hypothetical protein GCM10022198_23230 [Klugiella xanthotipulae]